MDRTGTFPGRRGPRAPDAADPARAGWRLRWGSRAAAAALVTGLALLLLREVPRPVPSADAPGRSARVLAATTLAAERPAAATTLPAERRSAATTLPAGRRSAATTLPAGRRSAARGGPGAPVRRNPPAPSAGSSAPAPPPASRPAPPAAAAAAPSRPGPDLPSPPVPADQAAGAPDAGPDRDRPASAVLQTGPGAPGGTPAGAGGPGQRPGSLVRGVLDADACARTDREQRPAHCPPQGSEVRAARAAAGSDRLARNPDRMPVRSRGEAMALRTAGWRDRCELDPGRTAAVCIPFGTVPPPPRTVGEICRRAGIGGNCAAAPDQAAVERARSQGAQPP